MRYVPGLFGFFSDGRKDTTKEITPTVAGYKEIDRQLHSIRDDGVSGISRHDPDVIRIANLHGKTVDDYIKYDLGRTPVD